MLKSESEETKELVGAIESVSRMIGPLRVLAKRAREAADRAHREFAEPHFHKSRQKNSDRALRIELACRLVVFMNIFFGRKLFVDVAEILNVFLGLGDHEVDANYVRDAWRDYGVSQFTGRPGRRRRQRKKEGHSAD